MMGGKIIPGTKTTPGRNGLLMVRKRLSPPPFFQNIGIEWKF